MSSQERRWPGVVVVLALFVVPACVVFSGDGDGDGETDELTPETSLPVASGRSFRVVSTLNAERDPVERRVSPSVETGAAPPEGPPDPTADPDWIGISRMVWRWCDPPIEARLGETLLGTGPAATSLRQAQHFLCVGHAYLNMAVSPTPTVIDAPTFTWGQYATSWTYWTTLAVDIHQVASTDATDPDAGAPIFEIPPQSASDAATLALIASEYFRAATFEHASVLRYCSDNPCVLGDPVPAGRRDGEDTNYGLSEDETVPALSVVVNGMIESWRSTREAADVTERLLGAAAQARLSDQEIDDRQAHVLAWRALTDSRLEQANRLVGVAPRMFEPDPSIIVRLYDAAGAYSGDGPVPAFGLYPVVDMETTNEAERRAEEMLRSTRVDPRSPDLPGDVLTALQEDHPGSFDTPLSGEIFFSDAGITAGDFRRAADRLIQEAAVFGRVIVPEYLVTGDPAPTGVVRVTGTTRTPDPDSAYLYALTAGSVRMNVGLFAGYESLLGLVYPEPNFDYAYRGIYGAADFASAALGMYLASDNYAALTAGGVTVTELQAHSIEQSAVAFRTEVHGLVPMRVDVALAGQVNAPGGPSFNEAYVAIRGVGDEIAAGFEGVYELWWGDEGLECATTGQVGLVACDPDNYGIEVAEESLEHAGGASGHGGDAVWLHVDHPPPPWVLLRGGGETTGILPAGERMYLTRRRATGGREALMGFDTTPYGPTATGSDVWIRWNQYPVGRPILDELHRILGPSAEDPSEPAMTCAGVPWDIRLPLEDELTEASEGSDRIESSFAHYLALARAAAEHADALGQELLQYGLEMDMRAEAARDQLEGICGDVVNVPDFTFDGGTTCETDEGCGTGEQCFVGVCITGDPEDLMPTSESDPDLEALRRCVGADEGDLVVATLGTERLCYFRPHGGLPCQCNEEECPRCPVSAPPEDCLSRATFPSLPADQYEVGLTEPLGVVEPSRRGDGPADCLALARLRERLPQDGEGMEDLLARVLSQSWINESTFRAFAEGASIDLHPSWYTTVRRGGNVWFATGDPFGGPTSDIVVQDDDTLGVANAWPCAPASAAVAGVLGCAETPNTVGAGDSILCGVGRCESVCGVVSDDSDGDGLVESVSVSGGGLRDPDGCRGRQAEYARLWLAVNAARDLTGVPHIYNAFAAQGHASEHVSYDVWGRQGSEPLPDGVTAIERYRFIGESDERCRDEPEPGEDEFGALSWWFSPHLCSWCEDLGRVAFMRWGRCGDVTPDASGSCLTFSSEMPFAQCPSLVLSQPVEAASSVTNDDDLRAYWRPWGGSRSITEFLQAHVEGGGPPGLAYENEVRYPSSAINELSVWDALELACMQVAEGGGGCPTDASSLPVVRSGADFPRLQRALQCAADSVELQAGALLFANLPASIVEDVRNGSVSATFPENRGTRGETVAQLRGSMADISTALALVGTALRDFSAGLQTARSELRISEYQSEIADYERWSAISSHVAACVAAVSPTISWGIGNFGLSANPGAAMAACIDAGVQTLIADAIASLRAAIGSEERDIILIRVADQFSDSMDLLSRAADDLDRAYANTNRLLAELDGQSRAAQRALSGVMFLGEDGVGREFAVNRAMRARYNTTLARYEDAHQDAVRMAFLARRAMEQRLGVDLSELTADMTLVEAPSTWADRVCTMSGVDYGAIREGAVESYSDGYVGDYVRDLEAFLESYRIDYPFQDGEDVAVLSLKNDLLGARVPCDVRGYNQLLWTVDLAAPDVGDGVGWTVECSDTGRCPMVDGYDGAPFARYSLDELVLGTTSDPIGGRPLGEAPGFRMTIGCDPEHLVGGVCETELGDGAGLSQMLPDMEAGLYLVSWYERLANAYVPDDENCFGSDLLPDDVPRLRAVVTFDDGSTLTIAPEAYLNVNEEHLDGCQWRRAFGAFHLDEPGSFAVRFEIDPTHLDPGTTEASEVWGAPQVEYMGGMDEADPSVLPEPFFPTDDDLSFEVGLCEDVEGESLRNDHWTYGCEYVCPDGFGGTCGSDAADRSLLRCYYETTFDLSLLEIERGHLVPTGALALGNFNYRIDSIAMNLVGENIRNCEHAEVPSSCHSNGSIPFSLRHSPPFRVRNYFGDVYESQLQVGNIEQARALTAERYLSNPLSSTDRQLIEPYLREELRGRPLEGHYRLRVYDVDGLDWRQLEDIQVLLNYRYWTRFGE